MEINLILHDIGVCTAQLTDNFLAEDVIELWSCVQHNEAKLKHQNVEQTTAYYRAKQGEQVICAPQTPNPLKGFIKAILKAR